MLRLLRNLFGPVVRLLSRGADVSFGHYPDGKRVVFTFVGAFGEVYRWSYEPAEDIPKRFLRPEGTGDASPPS